MARAAISIGSNLGDRLAHLRFAVDQISHRFTLAGISSLYLTAPVGGPAQGDYLNAVLLIDTDLPPSDVLAQLHVIEDAAGRVRRERFGARTLDLDLIAVEGVASSTAELELPHPRSHQRRFVIEPLVELWPEAPLMGGSAEHLMRTVRGQDAVRIAEQWRQEPIEFVGGTGLLITQLILLVALALSVVVTGSWPPTGLAWLGVIPFAVGAFLALEGARRLGPAFVPGPNPKRASLATAGVYGKVRHPIYLGMILGGLGLVIVTRAWPALSFAAVLILVLGAKARFEERRLRVIYPDYAAYAEKVRVRILPGL